MSKLISRPVAFYVKHISWFSSSNNKRSRTPATGFVFGNKAKRGIEVARQIILDLAESQSGRDPLHDAKRKLALVYIGLATDKFSDADTEIFCLLSKEHALKDEIERAQKYN